MTRTEAGEISDSNSLAGHRGGSKGGATGPCPQTMDKKLKLSCRAHMLVLQLPLMTIKQLINIAV